MKKNLLFILSVCSISVFAEVAEEVKLQAQLPDVFAKCAAHYRAIDAAATPLMGTEKKRMMPHGWAKGKLDMRSVTWWTAGHFPGSLWYLYEATGETWFKDRAMVWTALVSPNSKVDSNHDVGFIMYCSFGNARRLLKTCEYDDLLVETATTLCTRYNDKLGLIRSWGAKDETRNFRVIPDNMMNLELLMWAADARKGTPEGARFGAIARSHSDVTMKHHFRADGSAYHVLDYDQRTLRVKNIDRGQGASCETAWSRGQSWGIYGYTMMYRFTRDARYLEFAQKIADFAVDNVNMPKDCVPYWDYGAPGEERDTSAAAILDSALLELAQYVDAKKGAKYRGFAVKSLLSLSSPEYFAKAGENGDWLLKHGVGSKPGNNEIDVPLDYGDYYFLEALIRFRNSRGK